MLTLYTCTKRREGRSDASRAGQRCLVLGFIGKNYVLVELSPP